MIRKVLSILIFGCFLTILALPVMAGKDRDKTGYEEDNKYTDYRYGFQIQVPSDWKIGKFKKEPHDQRLIAVKKNPRIPPKLRDNRGAATKPTLMIFADSSKMTPSQLFAFIRSDTTESELKKEIVESTDLLDVFSRYQPEVLAQGPATVGGLPALRVKMRRQYAAQGSQMGGGYVTVQDFISGYIYIVQGNGWLLYMELVCENQFLPVLEETFTDIVNSFSMPKPEVDSTKTEEPSEG